MADSRSAIDPRTSQEALALSIARAVQLGLPAPDSPGAIQESVEAALASEAHTNEVALSYARVLTLVAATGLGYFVHLEPELIGLAQFPLELVWLSLLWTLAAGALAAAFTLGWQRHWFRWGMPLFDSLLISSALLVFYSGIDQPGRSIPAGAFGIAAVACSLLAFSGSLRLSRIAARLSSALALAAWVLVAWLGGLLLVPAAVIGALILSTGLFAGRIARLIRRVIEEEVARLRLLRLYQDAQSAIHAREDVLKIVSHDLRNPLSTIKMAAELLLDFPGTADQRDRHLRIIRRSSERMNRMIHDLLDAARIEAGTLPVEPEVTTLADVLSPVVEMMEPLIEEKSLTLATAEAASFPPIRVDRERIVQVYSNLIGNAIKFTPAGGTISLGAERIGPKIRLTVSDTGPGIPPEQLGDIFARMWQANRADGRGIGLGLTIARAIIEAHGEEIGVESRVGEGTDFWFTVPLAGAARDVGQAVMDAVPDDSSVMQ